MGLTTVLYEFFRVSGLSIRFLVFANAHTYKHACKVCIYIYTSMM